MTKESNKSSSFRFRFFLFILLIYTAGATLDVTNTNPGSRFMLTKEMAQTGTFAIREQVRERYSYLDYSVINQLKNSGFEEGSGENATNWSLGGNARRVNSTVHSGNYSLELPSFSDWIETQNFTPIAVSYIYENYTIQQWFINKGQFTAYINVSIVFTDNTTKVFPFSIQRSSTKLYSLQFSGDELTKSIKSLRFQKGNGSRLYIDDLEIYFSYSDKPPGLSLLALPVFWVGEFISVDLLHFDPFRWQLIDDFIKLIIILAVLAFGAFTVLKFYDFLRYEGISHKTANWVALLFGIGSLYYIYIGTFFSHSITASFLLLALYNGTKFRRERNLTSLLWAGILSGFVVVIDYITLFFLPIFYLFLFIPFPVKTKDVSSWVSYFKYFFSSTIIFFIPILVCGLLVTYYNFVTFGDPFVTPYSYARFFKDIQHFANPMANGLSVLLISTSHGLFTFMPIMVIAFLGFIPMFRKNPSLTSIVFTTLSMFLVLYSKYFLPSGGLAYGPRQLVFITPLFIFPLAYLLDLNTNKNDEIVLESLLASLKKAFIQSLKIIAVPLSLLTFVINFAGGWVSVYPLGGQDMLNPIWGDTKQIGHIPTLLSWFQVTPGLNGIFSLELIQGQNSGSVDLSLVVIKFSLNIFSPAASSLARTEIASFVALLFLIILLNPYYGIIDLGPYFKAKFNSIKTSKSKTRIKNLFKILLTFGVTLFLIWGIEGILSLIGFSIGDRVRSFLISLDHFRLNLTTIPIVSNLSYLFYVIMYILLNFIFIRSDLFSYQAWFILSLLFVLFVSFTWVFYPDQKENLEKSNYQDDTDTIKGEVGIGVNLGSHLLGKILVIVYIFLSVLTFFNQFFNLVTGPSDEFYSISSLILLLLTMFIILKGFIPQGMKQNFIQKRKTRFKRPIDSSTDQIDDNLVKFITTSLIISILLGIGTIVVSLKLLARIIKQKMDLTDFFIIRPSFNNLSIKNWFYRGAQAETVYLSIFLLFLAIILITSVLNIFTNQKKVLQVPWNHAIHNRTENSTSTNNNSSFQAFFIFGGFFLVFFYALITVLYYTLSSVPNPSKLPSYDEEGQLWILLLSIYIFGLFLSGKLITKLKSFLQNNK